MPVGTIISDAETGEVLYELLTPEINITTPKRGDGSEIALQERYHVTVPRASKTPWLGWVSARTSLEPALMIGLLACPGKSTSSRW